MARGLAAHSACSTRQSGLAALGCPSGYEPGPQAAQTTFERGRDPAAREREGQSRIRLLYVRLFRSSIERHAATSCSIFSLRGRRTPQRAFVGKLPKSNSRQRRRPRWRRASRDGLPPRRKPTNASECRLVANKRTPDVAVIALQLLQRCRS